jgi:hypothetical protein
VAQFPSIAFRAVTMNAIKEVRKYLLKKPGSASAKILARLTAAIGAESEFPLSDLYALDGEAFDLAIELLKDWRLDRYYAARIRLFDVALSEIPDPSAAPATPSSR